jgi:ABC-type sugar transport system ATPase subunit
MSELVGALPPGGGARTAPSDVALSATNVSKSYGAVRALQAVSLDVRSGSILALLGENGAGKSTFVAVASGATVPDTGTIRIAGEVVSFANPREAIRAGVQVVHQEPKLVNEYSIAENMFMSEAGARSAWRSRGIGVLASRAEKVLADLGLSADLPDVRTQAVSLTAAERQIVAIAKAMTGDPRVLFLDEPNSSLTNKETERLWTVARGLRENGVALVVVSHRLTELYEIVDRVAVLRDGRMVGTGSPAEISIKEALTLMAGAERTQRAQQAPSSGIDSDVPAAVPSGTRRDRPAAPVLSAREISNEHVKSVTFDVYAGEVLGMAGLVGAGRTEIGRALSGVDPISTGALLLDGKRVRFNSPRVAMRAGVVMACEERKRVVLQSQTVQTNLGISVLDGASRFGFIRPRVQRDLAQDWIQRLAVRGRSDAPIGSLSGGNQQKVLIARALATKPRVLILDEPTHGVDVATRAEIYELVKQLAAEGLAVVLISSDTEELVEQSDRIVVVRDHGVVGELAAGSNALSVVSAAMGQKYDPALNELAESGAGS